MVRVRDRGAVSPIFHCARLEISAENRQWLPHLSLRGRDGPFHFVARHGVDTNLNGDGALGEWPKDWETWQDALKYCEGLSLAGHDDWRLPNVRELQSIVDYERSDPDPAIDPVFGARRDWYWSSTTHDYLPSRALFVSFHDGTVYLGHKDAENLVRAVRGGL